MKKMAIHNGAKRNTGHRPHGQFLCRKVVGDGRGGIRPGRTESSRRKPGGIDELQTLTFCEGDYVLQQT